MLQAARFPFLVSAVVLGISGSLIAWVRIRSWPEPATGLTNLRTVSDPAPPTRAEEPRKGQVNGVRGS